MSGLDGLGWPTELPSEIADKPESDAADCWMPIETAPKDRLVLLYRPTALPWAMVTVGRWHDQRHHKKPKPFWEIWLKIGGIGESRAWEPTHWMDLPSPPNG